MADFLPRSDSQLLRWMTHFNDTLAPAPEIYGISEGDAAALAEAVGAYQSSLAEVTPTNRSRTLVIAKNGARTSVKRIARRLVKLARGTASVTDTQLAELGLRPRTADRRAASLPARAPSITIKTGYRTRPRITLYDSDSMRKGLPRGVVGAMIFICVGNDSPGPRGNWRFFMNTTRTNRTIDLPSVPPGTKVWFTAAWLDSLLVPGVWTSPVSMIVQHETSARSTISSGSTMRLAA